jgi:magnesium-transporting ATPase (P-type)
VASVPSITDLNLDPIVVATSLAVTAGVVFLVPFPAEMFNNTLVNHHEEIRRWFRRRRENNEARRFWDRPAGLVVFVVISALLFGFLDPSFGPNGDSVALFIGLLIGVVVTTLGFALPTLILRRARSKEWGRLRALPIALIVGVGCVVLSRVIGFVPGYLYGIVLGLAFTREVSEQDEAREVAVSAVVLLAVAILSWVALGAVRSGDGTGFAVDVGEAALATITVAAFEALTIGLLPLRGMPGRTLFANRKTWWIVIWGIAVLAFFHALVNPQSGYFSESTLVPVATTIALLVVFAAISVGMWGFFALKDRKKA